jgi:regulator of protease activity HflC (stomatin/prohibitin superfamily)
MSTTQIVVLIVIVLVVGVLLALAVRIVKQYERGVVLRFGRLHSLREPGLRLIIPFVDVMHRVSLRIVTMPIQSQGIITRDNVSVGISAVAYYHVVDPVKSVIAIENVLAAIDQIAQTTLRKVVGQHTLDETLAETDRINMDIRRILDITTLEWGVEVTLVELKDIQLPDSMKRAMAKQAEAEREKRAKIINAEGESLAAAALGAASDIMVGHPLALQLRNLQSLVEIGVDKNTTVVFPSPIMTTIAELNAFIASEASAAAETRSARPTAERRSRRRPQARPPTPPDAEAGPESGLASYGGRRHGTRQIRSPPSGLDRLLHVGQHEVKVTVTVPGHSVDHLAHERHLAGPPEGQGQRRSGLVGLEGVGPDPTPSGVRFTSVSAICLRHSSSNASKKWCGSCT